MVDYKKMPKLSNAKLIVKNKAHLKGKTLNDWIDKNSTIKMGDKTKTMSWISIKAPVSIFVTGDATVKDSNPVSIINHLVGIGKITNNKSSNIVGWVIKTDSGVAYFATKWTEGDYSTSTFLK